MSRSAALATYPVFGGLPWWDPQHDKQPTDTAEQVPEVPIESGLALSFDDAVAARLRGFGPLGVLSILGIMAGNLLVVPLSAIRRCCGHGVRTRLGET